MYVDALRASCDIEVNIAGGIKDRQHIVYGKGEVLADHATVAVIDDDREDPASHVLILGHDSNHAGGRIEI